MIISWRCCSRNHSREPFTFVMFGKTTTGLQKHLLLNTSVSLMVLLILRSNLITKIGLHLFQQHWFYYRSASTLFHLAFFEFPGSGGKGGGGFESPPLYKSESIDDYIMSWTWWFDRTLLITVGYTPISPHDDKIIISFPMLKWLFFLEFSYSCAEGQDS